jgi:hypothetical protein
MHIGVGSQMHTGIPYVVLHGGYVWLYTSRHRGLQPLVSKVEHCFCGSITTLTAISTLHSSHTQGTSCQSHYNVDHKSWLSQAIPLHVCRHRGLQASTTYKTTSIAKQALIGTNLDIWRKVSRKTALRREQHQTFSSAPKQA